MRQIEFRAIGSADSNWYYGQYTKCNSFKEDAPCIVDDENSFYEIDESTLGQFTGLFDKNHTKIYEGDIVRKYVNIYKNDWDQETLGFIDQYVSFEGYIYGQVHYIPSSGFVIKKAYVENELEGEAEKQSGKTQIICNRTEVIGNIYQNKELLNEQKTTV